MNPHTRRRHRRAQVEAAIEAAIRASGIRERRGPELDAVASMGRIHTAHTARSDRAVDGPVPTYSGAAARFHVAQSPAVPGRRPCSQAGPVSPTHDE